MIAPSPRLAPRSSLIDRLSSGREYDLAIIGGGATGLGVALEAASRGYKVVLVEAHDFAKGSSSRATKLVHGGVRYLAQGNIALVREALHERRTLLRNAPHLVSPLTFVMPSYHYWETPFYGTGLAMYEALAGRSGLGTTGMMGRQRTLQMLPGVQPAGLKGGVHYWDGQFDDARLAIALARTAAQHGALLLNYCPAVSLTHEAGRVVGLVCEDSETGRQYPIKAGCVVNATGVWVDHVRQLDSGGGGAARPPEPMVSPSQGVHLVVDAEFLAGDKALLVPRTRDGRVLFAVPWLGKIILGTTDTPRPDMPLEPDPYADEIAFLLEESSRYLARAPSRVDVRSVWVGLRPLVSPPHSSGQGGAATKTLSRAHTIVVSEHGLVTVTGGKWTTYRAMGEEVFDVCLNAALLPSKGGVSGASRTAHLPLVGATPGDPADDHDKSLANLATSLSQPAGMHLYGSEAAYVESLPGHRRDLIAAAVANAEGEPRDPRQAGTLTEAMVRFAARHEFARCVEDVLARRSRLLFLDAALARAVAPDVAEILVEELGCDPKLEAFMSLTDHYRRLPQRPSGMDVA